MEGYFPCRSGCVLADPSAALERHETSVFVAEIVAEDLLLELAVKHPCAGRSGTGVERIAVAAAADLLLATWFASCGTFATGSDFDL